MAADDPSGSVRVTNAQIYEEQLRQGRLLQTLADGAVAAATKADDHEQRLRKIEDQAVPIARDLEAESERTRSRLHRLENFATADRGKIDQLERTMASWSKAMWGLFSGLIIAVVGAVVAYGVLAK